jgi:hypothetical protein
MHKRGLDAKGHVRTPTVEDNVAAGHWFIYQGANEKMCLSGLGGSYA